MLHPGSESTGRPGPVQQQVAAASEARRAGGGGGGGAQPWTGTPTVATLASGSPRASSCHLGPGILQGRVSVDGSRLSLLHAQESAPG